MSIFKASSSYVSWIQIDFSLHSRMNKSSKWSFWKDIVEIYQKNFSLGRSKEAFRRYDFLKSIYELQTEIVIFRFFDFALITERNWLLCCQSE